MIENLTRIKLLVMDVDGTLTDGKIYMGPDGEVMKAFDVKDGYAIANLLPRMGIEPVVITGRSSAIVARRCEELGIVECHQGVADKLSVLMSILETRGLALENVVYTGDDLNDLGCMSAIKAGGGFSACPANASDDVKRASCFVSTRNGGDGFLRDVIDSMLAFRAEAYV